MNRILFTIILFICVNSFSQQSNILDKPKVDERVELLSIVFRLADAKEYNSKNGEVIKLVSITSISKLLSTPNSGFYSASKAALAAYLDGLRLQFRNSNIEVHEIILGFVRTNMTRNTPHAWNLGIESETAARLILKVINRKMIRVHSIPRTRNLPWLILHLIPKYLTDYFVGNAYRLIKK